MSLQIKQGLHIPALLYDIRLHFEHHWSFFAADHSTIAEACDAQLGRVSAVCKEGSLLLSRVFGEEVLEVMYLTDPKLYIHIAQHATSLAEGWFAPGYTKADVVERFTRFYIDAVCGPGETAITTPEHYDEAVREVLNDFGVEGELFDEVISKLVFVPKDEEDSNVTGVYVIDDQMARMYLGDTHDELVKIAARDRYIEVLDKALDAWFVDVEDVDGECRASIRNYYIDRFSAANPQDDLELAEGIQEDSVVNWEDLADVKPEQFPPASSPIGEDSDRDFLNVWADGKQSPQTSPDIDSTEVSLGNHGGVEWGYQNSGAVVGLTETPMNGFSSGIDPKDKAVLEAVNSIELVTDDSSDIIGLLEMAGRMAAVKNAVGTPQEASVLHENMVKTFLGPDASTVLEISQFDEYVKALDAALGVYVESGGRGVGMSDATCNAVREYFIERWQLDNPGSPVTQFPYLREYEVVTERTVDSEALEDLASVPDIQSIDDKLE